MGWIGRAWMNLEERVLTSLTRSRAARTQLAPHLLTGQLGELAAMLYLRRKGFIVVASRWSSRTEDGDLDLVAWHGPMLCFIEVKTRTAHDMAPAESAVDQHKRNVLRRLARVYIRQMKQAEFPPVRFDIVSVYLLKGGKREFVHFESAFGLSEQRNYWRN